MKKDYSKRIENLKRRRFDDQLNKSILSESFGKSKYKGSVKYALESMQAIERAYTANTFLASDKIQGHLTKGLADKGLIVNYRHQGSAMMNTSIKLHSDIDLLVITTKFETLENPQIPSNPYKGNPNQDLKDLRSDCFNILDNIYNQVDNSNSKSIQVFPTQPKRKVDVVVSNWFNSNDFAINSMGEDYRGIHIYDKDSNTRKKGFPFLHIKNVNSKSDRVNDGLGKLIRLLKTLKADADYDIKLSSFEITGLLYGISDYSLTKNKNNQLLLLREASNQLGKLITDSNYREQLVSPNGKEYIFGQNSNKVVELKKMKLEVDDLIQDIVEELSKFYKGIDNEIIYS